MKTIVTTFALSLALCAAAGATGQPVNNAPAIAPDTLMLSQTTDGDYLVRRFVVERQGDNDYSIRYQINLAKFSARFDDNSQELEALNAFISGLMSDTLANVRSVVITGYASPDGPVRLNETLAKNRAQDFRNYVDKQYNFSKKYNVSVNWVTENWEVTRALVARSSIPDKQAVLKIIDDKQPPEAKELALEKIPSAWDYMKANILPPLRRVELMINYGQGSVVEQRTMISKPKYVLQPEPAEPCCVVVDEAITGIMVEMPDPDSEYRKDARKERREVNQVVQGVEKLSKQELREANRIAREQERAALKIAKKEAKAAKAAEKAAQAVILAGG